MPKDLLYSLLFACRELEAVALVPRHVVNQNNQWVRDQRHDHVETMTQPMPGIRTQGAKWRIFTARFRFVYRKSE